MQQCWTWKRFPHFGVAYRLPGNALGVIVRCRVTSPSSPTFNYLDTKTESLDYTTDPQSPLLYSNVVLRESVTDKVSLEAQWNGRFLELSPKDLPAEEETVKGSRQRRAARLKTKEAEVEAVTSFEEELPEENDDDAEERRTLAELENTIMMRDLDRGRLGQETGRRSLPLLTKQQEIILGTMIQRSIPILKTKRMLRKKHKKKPTTEALAAACNLCQMETEKILKHAYRAKKLMMQYNVRLVYHVARLHKDRCSKENLGDLIMEGMGPRGLERAVMGFDPTLGHRFSTYAVMWIRQVVTRCIDNDLTTIRLPENWKVAVAKIKRAMDQLSIRYPNTPYEIAAIAKEVDLPMKKVRKCLKLTKNALSLERTAIFSRKGELVESLADQIEDPNSTDAMETIRKQTIREMLNSAMSILEPKERKVLQLRYGLDDEDGHAMTRNEVAKFFQITNERVRQIEVKAKLRMRKVWRQAFLDANLIDS